MRLYYWGPHFLMAVDQGLFSSPRKRPSFPATCLSPQQCILFLLGQKKNINATLILWIPLFLTSGHRFKGLMRLSQTYSDDLLLGKSKTWLVHICKIHFSMSQNIIPRMIPHIFTGSTHTEEKRIMHFVYSRWQET